MADGSAWSDERSRNFGSIAELYERVRPGYPAEAVDWLLSDGPREIADVGVGTGKLTDALIAAGHTVIAADPDPGMLDVLRGKHPGLETVVASAEHLPFADRSFDAVVFGQSWHWVDPPRGSAEVARILRPGGVLGLFWNIRDAREPWVAELAEIFDHRSADEIMMSAGGPVVTAPFAFDAETIVDWTSRIDVETLVDIAATHGFVITDAPKDRERLLDRVRDLGKRVADASGAIALPYRLHVYRFTRG